MKISPKKSVRANIRPHPALKNCNVGACHHDSLSSVVDLRLWRSPVIISSFPDDDLPQILIVINNI